MKTKRRTQRRRKPKKRTQINKSNLKPLRKRKNHKMLNLTLASHSLKRRKKFL